MKIRSQSCADLFIAGRAAVALHLLAGTHPCTLYVQTLKCSFPALPRKPCLHVVHKDLIGNSCDRTFN